MTLEQYATSQDGTPLHWKVAEPSGQRPVVILLPGGGFKNLFGIPTFVWQDLLNAGYLPFIHAEYRIAPPNKLRGQISNGRFPDQTNDVELAAATAAADSRCNGEVFVIGGSSGGSHALWLAGKGLVKAVVALSPATQLDDPASLYGHFQSDVQNYAPGNLSQASPNNLLATDEPPVFIAAFAQDSMPAPQFSLAVNKLNAIGAPHEAQLIPGTGHSWDCWPFVKDQVISFLNNA